MLLAPIFADAQALSYTAADTDAASLGMAGANVTNTSSVAYSAFSNAAVIPFSETKMDVAAGYTMWQPGGVGSNIVNVGAAFNMKDKFGVSLGFMYGMNPAYDVTNGSGSVTGTFKPADMHLSAGLSWRLLPFLSIGADIGYASSRLAAEYSYGALTADVFAMAKFSDFKLAVGVSDLGTGITSVSGDVFSLPSAVTLGLGYNRSFAEKHSIEAALDADYFFYGGFAAALGAGYTFNDLVSVRAGYRYSADSPVPSFASVGIGAKFLGIRLDVAYLMSSTAAANTLALGVGYSF